VQYRDFGRLGWKVSTLGFGAMRLPLTDNDPANIDEAESIKMIRYAIDHGVNYVDTAYPYHAGRSEVIVGLALKDGYRDKVKLATKLPPQAIESYNDFDRILAQQLERLQVNKVDIYLLHGMNRVNWSKLRDLNVLRWAEGAIADGRVGHMGFSFHDDFDVFKEIVDAYDNWAMSQIQYNYMDVDQQAGKRGLKYAADKGLAVVVMEPLRGGRLTKQPPESVARLWASVPQKRTPAEWALQWVLNQSEVSSALSGMSNMEQVIENVAIADRSKPGSLTAEELTLIEQVREEYRKTNAIPCTGCQYCMPCPNGVEIPRIFELYNDAVMYNDTFMTRYFYRGPAGLKEEQRADQCTECGDCLEICPQTLPIPELLKKAHGLLGPRK